MIFFSGSRIDKDARALIDAAGYTDNSHIAALNRLIKEYKTFGLWSITSGLYPIVGGSAATHKWNAKDPRDLDAAYRIVFSGTITHSATGMSGDGSTGYGDLKITPANLGTANIAIGLYCRTTGNVSSNARDIGGEQNRIWLKLGGTRVQIGTGTSTDISQIADTSGWFVGNRTGTTAFDFRRNDVSVTSGSTTSDFTNNTTESLYIMNNNFGGAPIAANYSQRQYAGMMVGLARTTQQLTDEYAIWNRFQTALSRNV